MNEHVTGPHGGESGGGVIECVMNDSLRDSLRHDPAAFQGLTD
ncbi:hypothetical protein [Methanoregula sp.]